MQEATCARDCWLLSLPRPLQRSPPLGRKAIFEIGGNYQAIAVYDEAAGFYERFARESPSMSEAPQALRDAVVLRLGTGDDVGAEKDADQFSRSFGRNRSSQS